MCEYLMRYVMYCIGEDGEDVSWQTRVLSSNYNQGIL